jgi:hypothetical protein
LVCRNRDGAGHRRQYSGYATRGDAKKIPTHPHVEYSPSNSGEPSIWELAYIKQQPGETVHNFWAKFLLVKDRMMDCCDQEIIATFRHNCRDEGILNTLARRHVQNFTELSDPIRKYCAMESAWKAQQMRVESIHVEEPRKAQVERIYPWRLSEYEPAEKKNRSLAGPRMVLVGVELAIYGAGLPLCWLG